MDNYYLIGIVVVLIILLLVGIYLYIKINNLNNKITQTEEKLLLYEKELTNAQDYIQDMDKDMKDIDNRLQKLEPKLNEVRIEEIRNAKQKNNEKKFLKGSLEKRRSIRKSKEETDSEDEKPDKRVSRSSVTINAY